MTTMLSLILAFMLSIGGSPAAGVNPAGCPGDTGIQAPIDNNRTINHFSGDYKQKTASRAISKKTGETPSIKDLETVNSIRFSRFSNEKLRQPRYSDHKSYRFNSVDPVINKFEALYNPQAWNLYAYCNNNPITYYDPDGRLIFVAPWLLNPPTVAAIIAAATAGGIAAHNLIKSIDITDKEVVEAIEGGVDIVSKVAAPTAVVASEVLKSVITKAKDEVGPNVINAKGGKENVKDSGLEGVSDSEISARAKDKSLSKEERKRYQKEEKARGLRNKSKRKK